MADTLNYCGKSMESFFDKTGRDRIIHDWLKLKHTGTRPNYVKLYEWVLAKNPHYKELNELIILAFEAGIEFSRATNRQAKGE